jgi:vitamin B12 transporter
MPSRTLRSRSARSSAFRLSSLIRFFNFLAILAVGVAEVHAASIRGFVTDTTGARIKGASVAVLNNGQVVAEAVSGANGSFEVLTGFSGRFFLVVTAKSFRQLETPSFYAGRLDAIERDLVLEPEWVRESIVVTATGTPTPRPQTSAATTVLGPLDLATRTDLISPLQTVPGTFVVQSGQRGAQTSLFIRGGNPNNNMVLVDGVDAGDLGGQFDFGSLATTVLESAEVYRGPNSNLYGADAASGVVSLTTPRGTTSFPSLFLQGDAGSFNTMRTEAQLAGAHNKFDYLGAYSWFQTSNALPMDQFHQGAAAGNFGWQPIASTQLRGTVHYLVGATGVPNAWDFYHVTDNATEKDQNLYISASIDNQTTADFHNLVRYGATRKREQYALWEQRGSGDFDAFGDSLGEVVTIRGANGYSVTGQAILDGPGTYSDQLVSNRDQVNYQGDYRFTPHFLALVGFRFEDERGVENIPTYSIHESTERTNYDYLAAVRGDYKNRFFYSLGGSLQHYSLFGTQTSPRVGLTLYVLRPRGGVFSGTRVLFNFGDAVREPKLTDQFGSLYDFLLAHGGEAAIQQFHIQPLSAPTTRTYEGGLVQSFLSDHILFRASYFHNQYGRELESVGAALVPALLPNLTPEQRLQLQQFLTQNFAFSLTLNSQAYRAQGAEVAVEGGIGRSIFLRGGYTYLDAVVQRSFSNDNQALLGGYAPTYNGIPIGAYSPLVGARPFRRAPHTGFFTATYAHQQWAGVFTAAFASRSDDSTYLSDANFGSTMLLPNRNLDYGYAKLDLGGSYQFLTWLSVYGQAENLTNNQHIGPIGYPSLPMNFRAGLKMQLGRGSR